MIAKFFVWVIAKCVKQDVRKQSYSNHFYFEHIKKRLAEATKGIK